MKQRMKIIIFSTSLLLVSFSAYAQVYKWTDENGKVHYTDRPPSNRSPEKVSASVNTYERVSYADSAFYSGEKVVMYSTSRCGYCKKARNYFTQQGIPFTEYDIDKSLSARQRYDELGARGVPVILYAGKRMNGFSEEGFKKFYN